MINLKFGYGVGLDGLPDIPEFHFFLGSGRPHTRFSSNVLFIFQKSLNVWRSQACRGPPHGQIEKEMCHLKAVKNKSFWMFSEPDTISVLQISSVSAYLPN